MTRRLTLLPNIWVRMALMMPPSSDSSRDPMEKAASAGRVAIAVAAMSTSSSWKMCAK